MLTTNRVFFYIVLLLSLFKVTNLTAVDVTIIVEDSTKQPALGVSVVMIHDNKDTLMAITDNSGIVVFRNVSLGNAKMIFNSQLYRKDTFDITIRTTELTFKFFLGTEEQIINSGEIPDAFSPNGNGLNETYQFNGVPYGAKIEIYDLLGELVYEEKSYAGDSWNGNFNGVGSPLPSGFYLLRVTSTKSTVGKLIQLIRNQ